MKERTFAVTEKQLRTLAAFAVNCGYTLRDVKDADYARKPVTPIEIEFCVQQVMGHIGKGKPVSVVSDRILGPDERPAVRH